jgi:hypothetical protein
MILKLNKYHMYHAWFHMLQWQIRDNGTKGVTKIYSYVATYGNAITMCVGVTVYEKNTKLKPTCAASGICLVMLHVANSSPH